MKPSIRTLCLRVEQKLETLIPKHLVKVTHTQNRGVKVTAIINSIPREYECGITWTTCDLAIQKIAADYTLAKYGERTG